MEDEAIKKLRLSIQGMSKKDLKKEWDEANGFSQKKTKVSSIEKVLRKALLEAAQWEFQLTKQESPEMTYAEARQRVVDRVFTKYYKKLL